MKKRKILVALGLVLLLDVMHRLYYAPGQRTLLEEIKRVDVIKVEKEKDLIHTNQPMQWAATDSKKRVRFVISIIWLCLMIWLCFMVWMIFAGVQTLLLWLIWLGAGLLNALFGTIYYVKRMRKS